MKKLIGIFILFFLFWGGIIFIAVQKKPRSHKGFFEDYGKLVVAMQTPQRDFLLDHIPEKSSNISYFILGLFLLEAKFYISEVDFIRWLNRKKFFLGEPPFENNLGCLPISNSYLDNVVLPIKKGIYLEVFQLCMRRGNVEIWPCITYKIIYDSSTSTCYYNFLSSQGKGEEINHLRIIKVNGEIGLCDKDGKFIIKPNISGRKQVDEYLKNTFGNYQFKY